MTKMGKVMITFGLIWIFVWYIAGVLPWDNALSV